MAYANDGVADSYDAVCRLCRERGRLHPHESFAEQIRLFAQQHRHDDVQEPAPDDDG
ncbi:MAG: hypothetical protein WD794_07720 [Mycobacteriales bacterium]